MKQKKACRFAHGCVVSSLVLLPAAATPVFVQKNAFQQSGTAQPPPELPPATEIVATPAAGTETNAVAVPTASPLEKFFNNRIPEAIGWGRFNLNARLRYEQVDEDGVAGLTQNSYAPTLRTRFGYTTAVLYGFQGMLEGVNVSVLGPQHNYNAAGSNGQGDRPVVADPPLTRLDQAWLAYRYVPYFQAKIGEQPINLDNQRFIGDVGWRQNMQTFDAVSMGSEPVKDLNLCYAYLWRVHRVFGNVSGLPAANTDFDSRSHLINISWSGWEYGRFVSYAYLLDLQNAAGAANSCATYGGYVSGAARLGDKISVDYRAEFAWQTDYAGSPLRYHAAYYNLEAGANIQPFAVGAGCENLGSGANTGAGGGRTSFRTPLATLHTFNGWADVFLVTPSNGLRDLYAYAQATLPAQIPLRFVYHQFQTDHGGGDYGQEFDVMASKKFSRCWVLLVKYACYQGADAPAPALPSAGVNIQKFWAQVEFNF
jgi:hypothetical protein